MERRAGFGVGDDGAGIEADGASGERGDFGFAVEAHDDGATGIVEIAEGVGEPGDAERVQAGGGLVEKEHGGTMDERPGDGDALAHAAGEGANERGAAFKEADFAEKSFGAGDGGFHFLQPGEEEEIFFGGEFIVDHGAVADVAGAIIGRGFGGSAGKRELPGGGTHDLAGNAQERGFAGAVAAGEDGAFTRGDFEGDAAESEESAIAFVDALEPETNWR